MFLLFLLLLLSLLLLLLQLYLLTILSPDPPSAAPPSLPCISAPINHEHPSLHHSADLPPSTHPVWLVLEYCPGNRLYDLLQADLKLPESSVKMFGLNLLGALQFLHSNGIVYGNLKPSAVQIDASGLLKLSDFSLSAYVGSQQSDADVQVGQHSAALRISHP